MLVPVHMAGGSKNVGTQQLTGGNAMITDKINSKLDEAKKLMRKLDKALALEYLWPEAFEHGRARAHWLGKKPARNTLPDTPLHLYHEFIITNGDGEQKFFGYEETPEILGGGLPVSAYRRVTNLTKG